MDKIISTTKKGFNQVHKLLFFLGLSMLFAISGCSTEELLVISDPVFLRCMEASDDAALNEYLKKEQYKLSIIEMDFDSSLEIVEPLIPLEGDTIVVFTPGLNELYSSIHEIYPNLPIYIADGIDKVPSSIDTTLSIIFENETHNTKSTVVIAGNSFRQQLSQELSFPEREYIEVYYWHRLEDEAVFTGWLEKQDMITRLFFLSRDVPVKVLKNILIKFPAVELYHDLVDTQFLEKIEDLTLKANIYTGRNYNVVLLNTLNRILSTRAAKNGSKP